jgi:hypothetical protein
VRFWKPPAEAAAIIGAILALLVWFNLRDLRREQDKATKENGQPASGNNPKCRALPTAPNDRYPGEGEHRAAEQTQWKRENCFGISAVILSAVAVFFTGKSYFLLIDNLKEARSATVEMRRQANVAETTLNGVQRPHLVVTDIRGQKSFTCFYGNQFTSNKESCPAAPAGQPNQTPEIDFTIKFKIHNFGQTPAKIIDASFNSCFLEKLPQTPFYFTNRFYSVRNRWMEGDKEIDGPIQGATVHNPNANNVRVDDPQRREIMITLQNESHQRDPITFPSPNELLGDTHPSLRILLGNYWIRRHHEPRRPATVRLQIS